MMRRKETILEFHFRVTKYILGQSTIVLWLLL